jgi:hypothetical protein
MKAYYLDDKTSESRELDLSAYADADDEAMHKIANLLRNNQNIHTLTIDKCELRDHGALVLRNAILTHKSLRNLCLTHLRMGSYPACTDDEYFFPESLDAAVNHLCAILREAELNFVEITQLHFIDRTQRRYQYIEMVEPASMRDLLTQEKQPYYFKEILANLRANLHLHRVHITAVDKDMYAEEQALQRHIKQQHQSENVNEILQGTHASAEASLMPEIYKFLALSAWAKRWNNRRKH